MWFGHNPSSFSGIILTMIFFSFEILQMLWTKSEDMHVVWIYIIVRLYFCNKTIKAGDINSLNLLVCNNFTVKKRRVSSGYRENIF